MRAGRLGTPDGSRILSEQGSRAAPGARGRSVLRLRVLGAGPVCTLMQTLSLHPCGPAETSDKCGQASQWSKRGLGALDSGAGPHCRRLYFLGKTLPTSVSPLRKGRKEEHRIVPSFK